MCAFVKGDHGARNSAFLGYVNASVELVGVDCVVLRVFFGNGNVSGIDLGEESGIVIKVWQGGNLEELEQLVFVFYWYAKE